MLTLGFSTPATSDQLSPDAPAPTGVAPKAPKTVTVVPAAVPGGPPMNGSLKDVLTYCDWEASTPDGVNATIFDLIKAGSLPNAPQAVLDAYRNLIGWEVLLRTSIPDPDMPRIWTDLAYVVRGFTYYAATYLKKTLWGVAQPTWGPNLRTAVAAFGTAVTANAAALKTLVTSSAKTCSRALAAAAAAAAAAARAQAAAQAQADAQAAAVKAAVDAAVARATADAAAASGSAEAQAAAVRAAVAAALTQAAAERAASDAAAYASAPKGLNKWVVGGVAVGAGMLLLGLLRHR